ncbi:MAG: FAD-binding oxidoreductase [Gammaproteobacteria bacterium]
MRNTVIRDLVDRLGEAGVVAEATDRSRYERGYRYGDGKALAVARPATTEELRKVVRYCYRNDLRMVSQGANTGLVGASTPDSSGSQIIVSLERIRGVRDLNSIDRVVSAWAGTRLSALNLELASEGLRFSIDLAADPSLGGMVATNTGGARLIRFGDAQRNLMGLEVVLADAEASVFSDMSGLRKDNSGADLKQLFVGTGGTFGIISCVQVEVQRVPAQVAAALVVPRDHSAVPLIVERMEHECGEFLSAFEGMSRNAVAAALTHNSRLRNPFGADPLPAYCLLIELSSALPGTVLDLGAVLTNALEKCAEDPDALIVDARLGAIDDLWALRHGISDGVRALGRLIAFDISVARSRLPRLRTQLISIVEEQFPFLRICDFGHCGDGGDHFNLVWPRGESSLPWDDARVSEIRNTVYRCVVERHGGSFSAEHGVGPYNAHYHRQFASELEKKMTHDWKRICDPKGLLPNALGTR